MNSEILKSIKSNFNDLHSTKLNRIEQFLDQDIFIELQACLLQNMCHIQGSTHLELSILKIESMIQILNTSSKIGWYRYDQKNKELELLTTMWIQDISNEAIQELIDSVSLELSVTRMLIAFLGNSANGKE